MTEFSKPEKAIEGDRRRCVIAAIKALTSDEIEIDGCDVTTTAPLLDRSIAHELREIETALGAKGQTRLFAIAAAIDEALLALAETRP